MTQDLIRYDVLVQDALRGVVKKIVAEVVKAGLPGQHHFYISFDTQHPGVRMSTRLRQRYPDEMTVVLQHQFWDLNVTDAAFEVGLSFSGIPERLYVPFNSIKGFFDPSVQFGLQFEPVRDAQAATGDTDDSAETTPGPVNLTSVQSLSSRPAVVRASEATGEQDDNSPKTTDAGERSKPQLKSVPASESDAAPSTGTVVSIDSFRKKT